MYSNNQMSKFLCCLISSFLFFSTCSCSKESESTSKNVTSNTTVQTTDTVKPSETTLATTTTEMTTTEATTSTEISNPDTTQATSYMKYAIGEHKPFNENRAWCRFYGENSNRSWWALIDETGKALYVSCGGDPGECINGITYIEQRDGFTVMDKDGNEIWDCPYSFRRRLSNGCFVAEKTIEEESFSNYSKKTTYYLFSLDGTAIASCDSAKGFFTEIDGKTVFYNNEDKSRYLIDLTSGIITDEKCEYLRQAEPECNGHYWVIDKKKTDIVLPTEEANIISANYTGEYYIYTMWGAAHNGKEYIGLADKDGNFMYEPYQCENLLSWSTDGYISCIINKKFSIVSPNGEVSNNTTGFDKIPTNVYIPGVQDLFYTKIMCTVSGGFIDMTAYDGYDIDYKDQEKNGYYSFDLKTIIVAVETVKEDELPRSDGKKIDY